MNKIRVGIFFRGTSREREVSFAGGRTVYDNLNKNIFEPVPVFVDSLGNFCLLNWQNIYKGTIRDFYPASAFLPSDSPFQYYIEYLQPDEKLQEKILQEAGIRIFPQDFSKHIDVAFLCLHGENGEDGTIQGLLEYYQIPYTGSGILPSAFGMNKSIQKKWMKEKGFLIPHQFIISRKRFQNTSMKELLDEIKKNTGFPVVIKPANQGSSIGVTVVKEEDENILYEAFCKAFFIRKINKTKWQKLNREEKIKKIREWADLRDGISFPALLISKNKTLLIKNPDECLQTLTLWNFPDEEITLEAVLSEQEVIAEEFLNGREFSCIVLENENGKPLALPPTEIIKPDAYFDYRSKYLPGLSRKETPMPVPSDVLHKIRRECERFYSEFDFNVYARIDGFYLNDGRIYLNDPNTTSGMMPSSFFFHQAAEIGLNPSQLITYIIYRSLVCRSQSKPGNEKWKRTLQQLNEILHHQKHSSSSRIPVAVILGGYSSERHISVESGRNVFEKLSSSEKYEPFPVFLTGQDSKHRLFRIPLPLLLKDNADDIRDEVLHYQPHPALEEIRSLAGEITKRFASSHALSPPSEISYDDLPELCKVVFIALHGIPGENGEVQLELEKRNIPYNGSGPDSSSVTIHKYKTNEILRQHGILVPEHVLIPKKDWKTSPEKVKEKIIDKFSFPLIAKPPDDGCSSAVKKIRNTEELSCYLETAFRDYDEIRPEQARILHILPNDPFPAKEEVLIEELIDKKNAEHFMEITGGMLTRYDKEGNIQYEIFEASEAVATGDVLTLEEKFLAGEGLNITPARYSNDPVKRQTISNEVKKVFLKVAQILNIEGYCRIDAFVRIYPDKTEVIIIEINSLPGMTPATCIFHQAALQNYKPIEFIDRILDFGMQRMKRKVHA